MDLLHHFGDGARRYAWPHLAMCIARWDPAWSWGPVGLKLSSPGAKRWGGPPTAMTRHRPRSGSLKTSPIRSMPSRVGEGRDEVGRWVGVWEGQTRHSEKKEGKSVQG